MGSCLVCLGACRYSKSKEAASSWTVEHVRQLVRVESLDQFVPSANSSGKFFCKLAVNEMTFNKSTLMIEISKQLELPIFSTKASQPLVSSRVHHSCTSISGPPAMPQSKK
jgi:hypothetical protein